MSHEARRSRRRWRRLRRELPRQPLPTVDTSEVTPDFVMTHDGLLAVGDSAPPSAPSPATS